MRVMKFGGSSVANRAQIDKVLGIVRARAAATPPITVVSSAHKGITDALIDAAKRALAGEHAPERVIDRQRAIAESLGCDDSLLAPLYAELSDLLRGIGLVRELSPRSLDYIASFGERMSTRCIADHFTREGVPAKQFDAWEVGFVTDDNFGRARPTDGFEDRVRAAFEAMDDGVVPIVTGFIGKNAAGEITTVGRNGSDLTATLLGAALRAEEVQIWSDTDGVLTVDPSLVEGAKNIPHMRFDEAAELAYFGSRVLHPSTLLPAMSHGIPVRVLNTNRPDHPGTIIREEAPANERAVTSIAYKEGQLIMTVGSTSMFGEAGFLAKVFDTCARHGVVVDVVTTSEVSISLTANDRAPLERAADELRALGEVTIVEGRTIVAIVGQHLAGRAGLGATILRAIADAEVNIEMVSYARGSINLSIVIADDDIGRAVGALHRVLLEQG